MIQRALPSSGRKGFTLIEIIMALSACAVILLAIYGVFSRAVKLRDQGTARTEEARARTRAVRIIREDLANGLISGGKMAAVLTGSREGQGSSFPGHLRFTATTSRDVADTLRGDLQQVEYFIVNDPEATDRKSGILVRAVDRLLLAPTRETPIPEPILRGVEAMELSFFDGQSWEETWDGSSVETNSTNSLGVSLTTFVVRTQPQAVRVTLRMAANAERVLNPRSVEVLVPWSSYNAASTPAPL
ncbi:MAG TPA: type II secretion system protein GspJ [Chthoniobacteraceae bacterium]|jgi:type II secretion system protein J